MPPVKRMPRSYKYKYKDTINFYLFPQAWAAIGELASDLGGDDASRSPQKLPLSARRPAPPAAESADPPVAMGAAADIAAAPSAFAAPAADRSAEALKAPAAAAPALPSPAAAVARNPRSTAPTEEEVRELDVEPTQAPAGALDSAGLQAPPRLPAELLQRKVRFTGTASFGAPGHSSAGLSGLHVLVV